MSDALSSFLAGLGGALTSPIFAMSFIAAIAIAIIYHWTIARRTFALSRGQAQKQKAAANPVDLVALRAIGDQQ